MNATDIELPPWAVVGDKRRAHIGRVVALLDGWAAAMQLAGDEAAAWRDAGRWHDAFRDADEQTLRAASGESAMLAELLHGPAAARKLESLGERRRDVIEAVRWHTVGSPGWGRTGRALYMADFLEPGRKFMVADRAYMAAQVPSAFDATFRQVVRLRIEWTLHEGKALFPETAALWNAVRDA